MDARQPLPVRRRRPSAVALPGTRRHAARRRKSPRADPHHVAQGDAARAGRVHPRGMGCARTARDDVGLRFLRRPARAPVVRAADRILFAQRRVPCTGRDGAGHDAVRGGLPRLRGDGIAARAARVVGARRGGRRVRGDRLLHRLHPDGRPARTGQTALARDLHGVPRARMHRHGRRRGRRPADLHVVLPAAERGARDRQHQSRADARDPPDTDRPRDADRHRVRHLQHADPRARRHGRAAAAAVLAQVRYLSEPRHRDRRARHAPAGAGRVDPPRGPPAHRGQEAARTLAAHRTGSPARRSRETHGRAQRRVAAGDDPHAAEDRDARLCEPRPARAAVDDQRLREAAAAERDAQPGAADPIDRPQHPLPAHADRRTARVHEGRTAAARCGAGCDRPARPARRHRSLRARAVRAAGQPVRLPAGHAAAAHGVDRRDAAAAGAAQPAVERVEVHAGRNGHAVGARGARRRCVAPAVRGRGHGHRHRHQRQPRHLPRVPAGAGCERRNRARPVHRAAHRRRDGWRAGRREPAGRWHRVLVPGRRAGARTRARAGVGTRPAVSSRRRGRARTRRARDGWPARRRTRRPDPARPRRAAHRYRGMARRGGGRTRLRGLRAARARASRHARPARDREAGRALKRARGADASFDAEADAAGPA